MGEIIVKRCATAGCHVDQSKEAAGGLSLENWTKMFEGGSGGSIAIPYRSDMSWLCYFVNTYSDLGISLKPSMPVNGKTLTRDEVITLKNWVDQGAPSNNGIIAFSGNDFRKKYYVIHKGCDDVAVFDADTKLLMRYIKVGSTEGTVNSAHNIKVSPDGKYWYVIFIADSVIQKFRTSDDSYVGSISIGQASWNTLTISPDGKKAFIVAWQDDGKIAYVDLENMTLLKMYSFPTLMVQPHGIAATSDFKTLYVTSQNGNDIYKIDVTLPMIPDLSYVLLQPGETVNQGSDTYDPHEIIFSPDGTKYFVSCQKTNEVRVFNQSNDSLIAVIPVGTNPLEFAISKKQSQLFVTCGEDPNVTGGNFKGSVYVINYNTLQIEKILNDKLYQPHGIQVDEKNNLLIVASENANPNGPVPHHTSLCGGRNGYVSFYDLNTLQQLYNYKTEVSVDPYQVAVRN